MIFVPREHFSKETIQYISGKNQLVIASRKSDLARLQSYNVGKALKAHFPDLNIKYHFRESLGDINLNDPLWKMPEKGVFTEDFYQDLVQHRVDLVVHSWKDLPIEDKEKTFIAATLKREDARDVLLFKIKSLQQKQLNIFTSSPRRIYNLESFFNWSLPWSFNKLEFQSVRGNIQTRVRKLMESDTADGLIVAKAALDRLISADESEFSETKNFLKNAFHDLVFQVLPLSQNPTAAAQGALAIEIAKDRTEIIPILEKINDKITYHNTSMERSILKKYGGGCHQKIGVSILKKNDQTIFFLKGLTDNKIVLNESTLIDSSKINNDYLIKKNKTLALHKILKKNITPVPYNLSEFYNSNEQKFLFITKNENFKNKTSVAIADKDILWTSGIATWQSLASDGYWVSGCFDSLGEDEEPNIKYLLSTITEQTSVKWVKLSHFYGKPSGWAKKLTTYSVSYENLDAFFDKEIDCYFWSHGELFKEFFQKFPEIKNKLHACGLGSTLDTIKEFIENENIIPCLNYQDWKNKFETL